jgi:hypothetical protein
LVIMKKKFLNWFNTRVDALLASEAWSRKRFAELERDTLLARCETLERTLALRDEKIGRLVVELAKEVQLAKDLYTETNVNRRKLADITDAQRASVVGRPFLTFGGQIK